MRVDVTPTHEHAGPSHKPAGRVSGGRGVRGVEVKLRLVSGRRLAAALLSPGSRQNASLGKHGALSRVPSVHLAVSIWRGIVVR